MRKLGAKGKSLFSFSFLVPSMKHDWTHEQLIIIAPSRHDMIACDLMSTDQNETVETFQTEVSLNSVDSIYRIKGNYGYIPLFN